GGVIGGFRTHLVFRANRDALSKGTATGDFWIFSHGWSPHLVENAGSIMYMGDQMISNTGLNDQFRLSWFLDDSPHMFFVDQTINPFLFTNGNATCPTNGGGFGIKDLCAGRMDHRIVGGVVEHNSRAPMGLGIAGDT